MSEDLPYEDLTDKEVKKVIEDCGFSLLDVKQFGNERFYYLKEEED